MTEQEIQVSEENVSASTINPVELVAANDTTSASPEETAMAEPQTEVQPLVVAADDQQSPVDAPITKSSATESLFIHTIVVDALHEAGVAVHFTEVELVKFIDLLKNKL